MSKKGLRQQIIDLGKAMLARPVQLLDDVAHVLDSLDEDYALMVLTKGDLFDQESKIARSGLAKYFQHVEIVSEKTAETYLHILQRYSIRKIKAVYLPHAAGPDDRIGRPPASSAKENGEQACIHRL